MRRLLFMMLSVALVLFACANDGTVSGGGDLPGDRSGDTTVDAAADASDASSADAAGDAADITDASDSG